MGTKNTHDYPDHFPRRANMYVKNLQFSADVDRNGHCRIELGKPVALAGAAIGALMDVSAVLINSAVNLVPDHRKLTGRYGRNVTITLSGAGTPNVTVHGLDYLGQPMSELIAATGAAAAAGNKAFKEVTGVTTSALVAATTMSIGFGNKLGVPYAVGAYLEEYLNEVAASAGTKVVAVLTDPQTVSTGDPRGTYVPASAPDGAKDYTLIVKCIEGDYHGVRHFSSL